jgi:hypothetical protein
VAGEVEAQSARHRWLLRVGQAGPAAVIFTRFLA